MTKINRRTFIEKTSMGLGAVLALSQIPKQLFAHASALDIPLGFQTYPVRDMIGKDFAGTLKMMAGLGYQVTEMCSPQGYTTTLWPAGKYETR
jgi:hypothetical protein